MDWRKLSGAYRAHAASVLKDDLDKANELHVLVPKAYPLKQQKLSYTKRRRSKSFRLIVHGM